MRLRSASFGLSALAVAFAILCVTGVLAWQSWSQHHVVASTSDETRQILSLNESLFDSVRDAETGQRGYLLTGRQNYLGPYHVAVGRIPSLLAQLRAHSTRDPELRRLLPQLQSAIDDKLKEAEATIALRQSKGFYASLAVVQTDYGKQKMDRVRELSQAIHGAEDARWRSAWNNVQTGVSRAFAITIAGTLILVFLVGSAGVALRQSSEKMEGLIDQLSHSKRSAEEARDLLRATLYGIGDAVITTDRNGVVQMMNSVAQRLTGYSESEACGRTIEEVFRIFNESTQAVVENPVRLVLKESRIAGLANHTVLVGKNGTGTPIEDSGAPITEKDGTITGVVLVFRDVSYRKNAEETALRLAAIVDSSADAIIGETLDGIVTSWNRAAEQLCGYTAREMIGASINGVIPADQIEESKALLRKIRDGNSVERFETWRLNKKGQRFAVSLTVSPVRDAEGHVIGAAEIARDITRERQLEDMLRQTQKMEAIGRLAGGVAHDFNNLLTVILGYADLIKSADSEAPPKHAIDQIVRAAERAASLTGQLLAFSRRQVVQSRIQDLNLLVHDTESMLRRLIGEDVDFSLALDRSPCLVNVDSGQLTQVLMNLALNARDAMPDGGRLTIETRVVDRLREDIGVNGTRPAGPCVLLAITDTGSGMDAEVQAHIFEPFFTTKDAGKGTGLGLATVYGIVQQHGGWIDVYSEPGNGACFKVYLPVADSGTFVAGIGETRQPVRRTRNILLVEDQAIIRTLAEKVLTDAGHRVLSAPDARTALQLASSDEHQIDLLLTDVVMPGMSGPELASQLSRSRPDMVVLFMSGYPDHALLHRGALEQGMAFLQKPFRAEGLISKIDELFARDLQAD